MFIDLNLNFHSLTVRDTIQLLSYFSFKCNGTVLIAEIHRLIMSDVNRFRTLLRISSSFYSFLCQVNKIIAPGKAVGSCTDPRATYWGGSSDLDWSKKSNELMSLIMQTRTYLKSSSSRVAVRNQVTLFIDVLMNGRYQSNGKLMFHGAGAMGANHFVHGCALLGLLPLACYNVAEIRDSNLGPAKFIKKALKLQKAPSPKKCTEILYDTYSKFSPLWNDMVSINFLENSFCYGSRTIDRTIKTLTTNDTNNEADYDATIIMDNDLRVESKTKNLYFMDERRGRMQNVYLIRTCGNGSSPTRPMLVMKDASRWSEGNAANVVLTNWECDKNDKKLLQWKLINDQFCLNSILNVADELVKMYSL